MTPAKEIFERLRERSEIAKLIGTTENLYLDCKTWPSNQDDGWRILSKALCGFSNAAGGVIVLGMETKQGSKLDPDVITGEKPVPDALYLQSRIEAVVGELVEPGLLGVETHSVLSGMGAMEGFVVVHAPATEGMPSRSRKTNLFHQRIASGTYPMEYFQIADMFGRRSRPALTLWLEQLPPRVTSSGGNLQAERAIVVGVKNYGRGLARFPSIRINAPSFHLNNNGVDGNGSQGLKELPSDRGWFVFGGGADHVIHPGTLLKIAKLTQDASSQWRPASAGETVYVFDPAQLTCEMFAEGVDSKVEKAVVGEGEISP